MRRVDIVPFARAILFKLREDYPGYVEYTQGIYFKSSGRMTRSAGKANWRTGEIRLSADIFSRPENEPGFRNTVLHEIAHIIANRLHGYPVGHSAKWKRLFKQIGGNGQRCHSYSTTPRKSSRQYVIQLACCGKKMLVGFQRYQRWNNGAAYTCRDHNCQRRWRAAGKPNRFNEDRPVLFLNDLLGV